MRTSPLGRFLPVATRWRGVKSFKSVVVATAVAMLLISGTQGLWLVITAIAVLAILRGLMMSRIGGTTGDTAGAAVELTETALLIVAAVM